MKSGATSRLGAGAGSFPAVLCALLLFAGEAGAAGLATSGYLKSLYTRQRSPTDGAPYDLDLNRARLSLEGGAPAAGLRLQARVDYDHELRLGSQLRSPEFRLLGPAEPPAYLDMDQLISSGTAHHYRHRLYRGWVGVEGERWLARFGRQRVAWGSGRLWNPTDALNPYQPTSVEREERRGSDALYLRRELGALGAAEVAWGLAGRWSETDLLARARGNAGGADLSLMGGKVASSSSSWMLGADAAADLWGGNLHGEMSYVEPRTRPAFWRLVSGYEYRFPAETSLGPLRDAWAVAEYYRNGAGETDPARYDPARLLDGREVSLGRDYAGFGFQKDLTPLLHLDLYGIVNLGDDSHFFGPALSWNALGDLHLSAGLQRFGGSRLSEFGRLPNLAYLQGQFYF